MARLAARRGAAFLGLALARSLPAATRRAHARARPRRIRTDSARSGRVLHYALMTAAREIVFTRHGGARGFAWLKDSYGMFRSVPLAWILLLTSYYMMLVLVDFVPLVG